MGILVGLVLTAAMYTIGSQIPGVDWRMEKIADMMGERND